MNLSLNIRLGNIRIRWDVFWAQMLYRILGLEAVVVFLKHLNKKSVEHVLRYFGAEIGKNCDIESGITLHNVGVDFSKLSVGNLCHIGKDVFLDLRAPISIHERSTVSMRSLIITHIDLGHAGNLGGRECRSASRIEIGPRAYIGAGAIILPGVRVGEGSLVGAGSLVRKDVLPGTAVAGVPAKQLGDMER